MKDAGHSYLWHLEQAAIEQQLANRAVKRGYFAAAEKHEDRAQQHRDQAAILDLEKRVA